MHILNNVNMYVLFQTLVGADKLRRLALETADIKSGETLIDVGCGPAYYFNWLPKQINYYGFDTDSTYIKNAVKKYGNRGNFINGIFDNESAKTVQSPDVIVLLGLLHHLTDEQCLDLLNLSSQVLSENGRVVSIDPTFLPNQPKFSKWMSENDRGKFVRNPEEYNSLAENFFNDVKTTPIQRYGRILGSHWMMNLSKPKLLTS